MAQREVKASIVLGGRVDGSVNVIGAKLDESGIAARFGV